MLENVVTVDSLTVAHSLPNECSLLPRLQEIITPFLLFKGHVPPTDYGGLTA